MRAQQLRGNLASCRSSPRDVRRLHRHEVRRDELLSSEDLLGPGPVRSCVDEERARGRRIHDEPLPAVRIR